jgi:putative transposase
MDNIFVERLWRSLKYEEVYLNAYASVAEAKAGIGSWLAFYNEERQHQSLGYRTPRQAYEAECPWIMWTIGFADRLRLRPHPHRHNVTVR